MKLSLLVSFILLAVTSAFSPVHQSSKLSTNTALFGFLDKLFDKPLHGHGSGENDLDEQWEAQQAILRERRSHGIDKEHLMEKYSHEENRKKFDVSAKAGQNYEGEMYVEENKAPANKIKFPWDK